MSGGGGGFSVSCLASRNRHEKYTDLKLLSSPLFFSELINKTFMSISVQCISHNSKRPFYSIMHKLYLQGDDISTQIQCQLNCQGMPCVYNSFRLNLVIHTAKCKNTFAFLILVTLHEKKKETRTFITSEATWQICH